MKEKLSCDSCGTLGCRLDGKYPKFCLTKGLEEGVLEDVIDGYRDDGEDLKIMQVSSEVEARNYLKMARVEETLEFIKKMGYKKVAIASCISMLEESGVFADILRNNSIDCEVVSCKIGAVDKGELGIPDENRIRPHLNHESMCNPIMQAKYINENAEFAIVIGLCVGHDSLFYKHVEVATTTMIVKDRVTCHNPAAPLKYTGGIYSKLFK